MKNKLNFFSVFSFLAITMLVAPTFANAALLTRQLEMGMSGSDVSSLQTFLAVNPVIYPQGLVTGYFGFLTKSAVSNFQSANGIPAVGRVGPVTLSAINTQMLNGSNNSSADKTAPSIYNVDINEGKTTASISWNTSDSARGKVYYSTQPMQITNTFDYNGINFVEPTVAGTLAPYNSDSKTSHSVNIENLSADTKYYYVIVVLDQATNVNLVVNNSFHTNQ